MSNPTPPAAPETLAAAVEKWLADGYTANETPLDGYGREVLSDVLALAAQHDAEMARLRQALLLLDEQYRDMRSQRDELQQVNPFGSEVLCERCAHTFCPHGEQLHFHHDGCPACDTLFGHGDPTA